MTRNPTLLVLFVAVSLHASAQRSVEVGVSQGVTHYFGDLGNEEGAV